MGAVVDIDPPIIIVVCGKNCGKICGKMEKLLDWNIYWCNSRY